jgi:hypothetical protein
MPHLALAWEEVYRGRGEEFKYYDEHCTEDYREDYREDYKENCEENCEENYAKESPAQSESAFTRNSDAPQSTQNLFFGIQPSGTPACTAMPVSACAAVDPEWSSKK